VTHNPQLDIRIGTLVDGKKPDPAHYIAQILPHGFESFSLTFWGNLDGVDLPRLADQVKAALGDADAVISSVAIYGNPLDTQPGDVATLRGWETLIDHAHLFGAGIVAGFTGRLRGQPIDACIPRFKEVFEPLTQRAADRGVRLAFECCDMGGNWRTGDWNIAHTPAAWELMFDAVPAENLGWNGSHATRW